MKGKIKETGDEKKGNLHRFRKGANVKIIEIHALHYLCQSKSGKTWIVQKDQIDIL